MAASRVVRRVRAFPVYLQYRLTGLILDTRGVPPEQANVVWDKLHARHVDEMLAMVRRLKGYFIKICQLASARVDLLPLIWVERFRHVRISLYSQT